jgi:hypothetical protein
MSDQIRAIIKRYERLKGDRGTFEAAWQEVSEYTNPNRANYTTTTTPGQKRMRRVFDATAIWANQQFAAGMHSFLTSPTLRWFALRTDDEKLNRNTDIAIWLDEASDRMYSLFNGADRNFATQSTELYEDIGCIGTAVMAVLESPRVNVLFSTKPMGECLIAENEEDRVDTLYRAFRFTAAQAVAQWGSAAGEKVVRAAGDTPDKPFRFLHAVRPRAVRDPQRAEARHKAFESRYIALDDMAEIAQGGFDEFPYLAPRFAKQPGEIYGRSPAMTALPDIKMLNELMKLYVKAAQKTLDPPLNVPEDGYQLPIKTMPNGINFFRPGIRDKVEPLMQGNDVRIGDQLLGGLRQQVLRHFYADLMRLPTDPNDPMAAGKGVTATYTMHQRDQDMRMLSPLLARQQSEFLGPLIDRTFAIMWRQSKALRFGPGSMLPPPPELLAGQKLAVEYVSPIAVAQKSSQLDGVQRLVQSAITLGQIDPLAVQMLDVEAILRLTGRDLNTPAALIKSPERVQAEAAARAKAEQAQQEQQAMLAATKSAQQGAGAISQLQAAGQPQGQAA